MSLDANTNYLHGLVTELLKLPRETGWVEFKVNNTNPEEIGEYLSALSNTAALLGKASAYLIWGVEDSTHDVTGTTFKPGLSKKGNEDLENWLQRQLTPRIHFHFYEFNYRDKPLVLLEIPRASVAPTRFAGIEYIRSGSYRQKLKDYPLLERDLWRVFDSTPFEDLNAMVRVDTDRVLSLLDYPRYFELLSRELPAGRAQILDYLTDDRLITPNDSGSWSISNLGAILFAKNLDSFKSLSRKAVRIIVYQGRGRLKTIRERDGRWSFTGVVSLLQGM